MGNLKSHLRIDDEAKRLQCVALLGKMFSESIKLSKTHSEVFKLFAQRFLDKSTNVRIEMIKCSMQIQQNVPHLRSELLARISEKLEDQSPAVRIVAVDSMCTIAINNVERLPVNVFRKLITRKDDKKFDIANSAIMAYLVFLRGTLALNGPMIGILHWAHRRYSLLFQSRPESDYQIFLVL